MPRCEIKVFTRRLALRRAFRIAHGSYAFRESVFLHLSFDGRAGIGEAPIVPYYGVSTAEVEADLRTRLSGELVRRAVDGDEIPPEAFRYAVSSCAFQTAVLSLRRRLRSNAEHGIAESALSPGADSVPPTSYTIPNDDDVGSMVELAATCGFRRLKVKMGFENDIEGLRRIRERLPDAILRVDANQGWAFDECIGKIAALEELGIELIEEPINGDEHQLEQIAAATSIPVILDESVRTVEQLHRYVQRAPSITGIVAKIAKNGGPLASYRLIREAHDLGLKVMVSSMIETSLGVAEAVRLASRCQWCDLDTPLLLAHDPFVGLSYVDERPCFVAPPGSDAADEVRPDGELQSFIDALAPIPVDC